MVASCKARFVKVLQACAKDDWQFALTAVGAQLWTAPSDSVTRHIFFNVVRDDMLGLRIQPALGVTLSAVNQTRDRISPRHDHTVDVVTAYVLVNGLLEENFKMRGGWLLDANDSLEVEALALIELVRDASARSGFFQAFHDEAAYVREVESQRWPLVAVMPAYLYALIACGELAKAKTLAAKERESIVASAKERGLVLHQAELQQYDDVLHHESQ